MIVLLVHGTLYYVMYKTESLVVIHIHITNSLAYIDIQIFKQMSISFLQGQIHIHISPLMALRTLEMS